MQYVLAVSYFPKSQEWPISWWAPVDRKYPLDGWDLAVCASWGGFSVLHGYYIDAFRMINQVSSLIVLFNVVSHYCNLRYSPFSFWNTPYVNLSTHTSFSFYYFLLVLVLVLGNFHKI